MNLKNLFNRSQALFSDLREKIILCKGKHPERVIAAMFIIMLLSVASLLLTKATHKGTYSGSIQSFPHKLKSGDMLPKSGKSLTTEMMDLLSAYSQVKSINPDSITSKDSLLLKEIDKDLNKILDEKD